MSSHVSVKASRWKGIIFVLISGCCWGFHGVLIKLALEYGISFFQVFFFEVIFATAIFSLFYRRFWRPVRPTRWIHWLIICALGIDTVGVGYFLFMSFSLGPVAIGATLMFMYLPVVYAYTLLTGHQKLSWAKVGSIVLILSGAVLTTEILSLFQQPGILPAVYTGIAASMCYALIFILTPGAAHFTTAEFRSFAVSGLGIVGSLGIFALMPQLWIPLPESLLPVFLMGILLAVVGQTLPVYTMMKGLPITGSSLGGVLASIELPIAVFSSALILGESFTLLKTMGVVLVLTGIVLYNLSDRNRA